MLTRFFLQWLDLSPSLVVAGLSGIMISPASPLQAQETRYTVIDLGGYRVQVHRMNATGEVVGERQSRDGHDFHAFLYANGEMHDLGTPGESSSAAPGINDAGQVVGVSDSHGFLYSEGKMRDLGTVEGKPGFGRANDINRSSAIVGSPRNRSMACLYKSGQMRALGDPDDLSTANRINASGQIVGHGVVNDSGDKDEHALLFADGHTTDLGTLGGKHSDALDINAAGEIVGWAKTESGRTHAFIYFAGKMRDLGVPDEFEGSEAKGINASGQIVGSGATTTDGGFLKIITTSRAYLYEQGKWIDLNTRVNLADSGLNVLIFAEAINDRGQIAGEALGEDGMHGFLLTPITANMK
jgi:probable HAF family extracellular repeat protein